MKQSKFDDSKYTNTVIQCIVVNTIPQITTVAWNIILKSHAEYISLFLVWLIKRSECGGGRDMTLLEQAVNKRAKGVDFYSRTPITNY